MTHQTGRRTAQMTAALVVAVAPALAPIVANATAFQLRGGSATAIGAALAGRTANDADVSLSIQNPAALRGVQGFEISGGLTGIFPSSEATAFVGANRLGAEDPNQSAIVPSFAAGWRANEQVVLGLAVKVPFGLGTEYSDTFPFAIDGTTSELTTISVTPQISFDFSPRLSIGGGFTVQYADSELANAAPLPTGVTPFNVTGDGTTMGFTVGAIFEPLNGTTVGINYQSGFSHKLSGNFSPIFPPFSGPLAGINNGAAGTAEFDLPDILSIGVIQRVTDDVRLMGEFEWTGWSDFDVITITNTDQDFVVSADQQGYDDSFMLSVGGEYDWNDRLTVRAGVAYDRTPTTDAFRSQRTPDSDRYWLSAGASYEITESIGIDAAYLFILGDDATIQDPDSQVPGSRVEVTDVMVHYFALNLRYAF